MANPADKVASEHWSWFVTPMSEMGGDAAATLPLSTRNFRDFCQLCPSYKVGEKDFSIPTAKTTDKSEMLATRTLQFVREKGFITSVATLTLSSFESSIKQSICINYCIPEYDINQVSKLSNILTIAEIILPTKQNQTVKVSITPLEKINEAVKTKWSKDTYSKVRDLVIYYVNQLSREQQDVNPLLSLYNNKVDRRIELAHEASSDEKAIHYLFRSPIESKADSFLLQTNAWCKLGKLYFRRPGWVPR